ncbi:hypothetical protein BGZ70_000839 [Mortierella alpina]|uniref:AB hydrolase-1 domain-containing protein n=1 Tax=Mortierella alpina TaxID=64518 RepID=A0A9P6LYP2_MORAP|nr:hypothetical protein BGZ70_000839 [Mortierella alpina]
MSVAASALRTRLHVARHIVPAATPGFSVMCNSYRFPSLPKTTPDSVAGNASASDTTPLTSPPVLFNHANGFHKEMWEPIIARLPSTRSGSPMYAFDCRNHGDSAVLNSSVLEKTFDWLTYAKDTLSVIDQLVTEKPLGIGHSFGANAILMAEILRPGTFSAIVAIDPTMFPAHFKIQAPLDDHPLANLALRRRDHWKDRAEAKTKLLEKPFFRAWDPETLDIYLEHGMKEVSGKDGSLGVTLKCSKFQEAITFASDGSAIHDAFERLGEINIPVYIIAGEHSEINTPDLLQMKLEQCKNGSLDIVKDAGHLFPMEKPVETAAYVSSFMESLWGSHRSEQAIEGIRSR